MWGTTITVTASYTDGQGGAESVSSAATSSVANVNDAPSGSVTISGTAVEDGVLTAANTLTDEDVLGTISYSWSNGDTGATTTLGQSDVGNTITVTGSYTDSLNTAESVSSAATSSVANVNDAPSGSVTISGTAVEDGVLTAANTLTDEDVLGTINYTWSNGDTGATTTLGQSDVGNTITVTASYTDGQGGAESVSSAATSSVANVNDAPSGSVTISGTAVEDGVLTAANTLTDEDVLGTISYSWSNGDTGATTTLGQSDVGNTIRVTASYTDGQGEHGGECDQCGDRQCCQCERCTERERDDQRDGGGGWGVDSSQHAYGRGRAGDDQLHLEQWGHRGDDDTGTVGCGEHDHGDGELHGRAGWSRECEQRSDKQCCQCERRAEWECDDQRDGGGGWGVDSSQHAYGRGRAGDD